MTTVLLIPVDGPLEEIELVDGDGSLEQLQGLVGGLIQALPLPRFIDGADTATAYINEEGKFDPDQRRNGRATDFFVPGEGLLWGDYIVGPLVLAGFIPYSGKHAELPEGVVKRARLIESEAG